MPELSLSLSLCVRFPNCTQVMCQVQLWWLSCQAKPDVLKVQGFPGGKKLRRSSTRVVFLERTRRIGTGLTSSEQASEDHSLIHPPTNPEAANGELIGTDTYRIQLDLGILCDYGITQPRVTGRPVTTYVFGPSAT